MNRKPIDRRPWGTGEVLREGTGHKVKILTILPKKRLSLQYHRRRSETWILLEGRAKITLGRSLCALKISALKKGDSLFVGKKEIHRIENPAGRSLLKILEVQWGNRPREDDIVRLADDFGRRALCAKK